MRTIGSKRQGYGLRQSLFATKNFPEGVSIVSVYSLPCFVIICSV